MEPTNKTRPNWLGIEDIQEDEQRPDWDVYARQQEEAINEIFNRIKENTMQLTDVTIQNATFKSKGVNPKTGPWEIWELTIDGKKYGYFRKDNEDLSAGKQIAFAEYEEKPSPNGRYMNLSIKRLVWADVPPAGYVEPPQEPKPYVPDVRIEIPDSMLLSYVKDMEVAVVDVLAARAEMSLEARVLEVARAFIKMRNVIAGDEVPF